MPARFSVFQRCLPSKLSILFPSAHTAFMLSQVAPASGTYTCCFFLELLSPWICGFHCHSHLGRNIPPRSSLLDHWTLYSTQYILPIPSPTGFLSRKGGLLYLPGRVAIGLNKRTNVTHSVWCPALGKWLSLLRTAFREKVSGLNF